MIFILVAAVAILGAFAIERAGRRSDTAQLSERAGAIASAIERRANANASYLRASAVLFTIRDGLPGAQFRRFVGELWRDTDYRGARSIGWAPRIARGQLDAFNRVLALEYGDGARFHPALDPGQSYGLPVIYSVHVSGASPQAMGFDMNSEPVRRAAMAEAERTGRPTVSGKLVLLKDQTTGSPGFIIYMPVFSTEPAPNRLRGFVFCTFNAANFLA